MLHYVESTNFTPQNERKCLCYAFMQLIIRDECRSWHPFLKYYSLQARKIPHQFHSIAASKDLHYLNDLYVYKSWVFFSTFGLSSSPSYKVLKLWSEEEEKKIGLIISRKFHDHWEISSFERDIFFNVEIFSIELR